VPLTLSLARDLLIALMPIGAAGLVVSLLLDAVRRRFPLPVPPAPAPIGAHRFLLGVLWSPLLAFVLAVGLSALAGVLVALLSGGDGWAALDSAIYNALGSQVTWAINHLARNPYRRRVIFPTDYPPEAFGFRVASTVVEPPGFRAASTPDDRRGE
jgi:hypothetical protein